MDPKFFSDEEAAEQFKKSKKQKKFTMSEASNFAVYSQANQSAYPDQNP